MAKRKLSGTQRVAIRKSIRSKISAGVAKAEVLRTVAADYRVSPETVRWYLKSGGNGSVSHRPGPKRNSKRKAARPAKDGGLLALVRTISEKGLKRALAAKKLMPKLEAKLALKRRLQGVVAKAGKALRAAGSQARRLQRKVARLTAR